MRIDHQKEFHPNVESRTDLTRSDYAAQIMQDIAVKHQAGFDEDELGPKFRKNTAYLGLWPMLYAEYMVFEKPSDPMGHRIGEFAQGMAFAIMNSRRDQRHIVFQEAILLWDYLRVSGQADHASTVEMMHAITEDLSRRPQFQSILSDLFCLNNPNMVEDQVNAVPAINAFLLKHADVAEALFKGLKGSFLIAMNTFDPEVWKPHCKSPVRIDMQMGRDLGL